MKLLKSILFGSLLTVAAFAGAAAEEAVVKLEAVNPPELWNPISAGFSHAVIATGGARVAYLAGQGANDGAGKFGKTMKEQIAQAFANLRVAIASVGGKPSQVTKINTYLVGYDQSMLEPLAKEVARTFGSHLPAQTLVPVPRLARDGMLFEVDATVILD